MMDDNWYGYLRIRGNSRQGQNLRDMQFEMDLLARGKTPMEVEEILAAWRRVERCE